MKFTRNKDVGNYTTQDDTRSYVIFHDGRQWHLVIRMLPINMVSDIGCITRTLRLAKAVAIEYSKLSDDYRPSSHGWRSRTTEAIQRANVLLDQNGHVEIVPARADLDEPTQARCSWDCICDKCCPESYLSWLR